MGPEACPRGQAPRSSLWKGALEALTLEEVIPFTGLYRITTSFGHGSSEFLKLAALFFHKADILLGNL